MSIMPAEETAPEATTTLQRMEQRSRDASIYQCIGVMNDIIGTHLPGPLYINTRSLLRIVADILNRTTRHGTELGNLDLDILSSTTEDTMLKLLAKDIRRIRNELLCYYDDSEDRQEADVAHALFKAVSRYPWEAKMVMVLGAFAVNYGDDWLNAQLYTTNSLAQSIAFLKQLPNITSSHTHNNPKLIELLDHIDNLIKAMLRIINSVIEFSELPQGYISVDDSNSMSRASELIYTAVYWTVRGVMVCASKFNGLLLPDTPEGHAMESWKYSLPPLDHKIDRIHSNLRRQIDNCLQEIEDKKRIQVHETLAKLLRTTQAYNTTVLKVLLCSMNDSPLLDGSTNKRVGVEVLKGKTVMLLISDLDLTLEEVLVLEQIYNDVNLGQSERPYEVVWLPVLNEISNIEQDATFRRLQSAMPWYSLHHPSLLHTGVIKYIKQQWHLDKKPIIVVLDRQGKVACFNAIHMMWIWGITAYPFTKIREEKLWMEEKWTIEFLVDGIDPSILNWIRDEKVVCLYGGEDINWIREFTSTMKRVAQEAKIPLEMVYIGKSNPKEQVKKNVNIIMKEKLSQSWQDMMSIWFFWVRLESMWYSKMQYNRTIDNDPMMREITRMLTFDGSNDGWAVIGKGTEEMAKAHGNKIIEVLGNFSEWKKDIEGHGFMQALINALSSYSNPEHCSCLVLPGSQGRTHELSCAECGRQMDMYILYRCCND